MEKTTTEIEEGEACYYKKNNGENTRIDPDIDFSYIDERIEHVLGQFQKDFEGGVSAENLGAKFGGYGSFLPTYERSPSRLHAKTPQRNQYTTRSPENLSVEGAFKNCTAPSNSPPPVRLGTSSCTAQSLHVTEVPPANVTGKQDSCLSAAPVAEKSRLKRETLKQSVNPADRKPKVRIKVGTNNKIRKNAAIYSGLGLDNSPSSSLGNSPEESGGMQLEYGEAPEESPTSILQTMTSFPVPGGWVLSPLHDSLLCLIMKEGLLGGSNFVPVLKSSQENAANIPDETASTTRVVQGLKEKNAGSIEKSARLLETKHGDGTSFENDNTVASNKNIKHETYEGREFMFSHLKHGVPSDSVWAVSEPPKGSGRAYETFREDNKDMIKCKLSSPDLVKEESFGSQESCKSEKVNVKFSSADKAWKSKVANHQRDVLLDMKNGDRCKSNKTSAPLNADESKQEEDCKVGATEPTRRKVDQKAAFHKHDVIMPYGIQKASFEGKKKSKGVQSSGKPAANVAEESFRVGLCAVPKDEKESGSGVYPVKTKTPKLKSRKAIGNVRDNCNDFFGDKKVDQRDMRTDKLERPSSNRPTKTNIDYVEKEENAKPKERSTGKRVDKHPVSEASLSQAPNAGPPLVENGLCPEMVSVVAVPVVIEEDWVCCDSCQKWRLLPYGTKPEQLPENWLCSMLNWLPGMNRCDIGEEETTKALRAWYQCPVSESQVNLLNHANEAASGVTSLNVQHLDQNHQNLSSQAIADGEKKKNKTKAIPNAGCNDGLMQISNPAKNHSQESGKSRSLNDMNQPVLDSSFARKHLIKSRELPVQKPIPKQKEKHMHKVDAKQTMTKSKREADRYVYGASKKVKAESVSCSAKYWTSENDRELGRVGLSSDNDFSVKASGKDMQDIGLLKDAAKDGLSMPMKRVGDQSQSSLDGVSSDLQTSNKRDTSLKKRKLKDWQDSQNDMETSQTMGHNFSDRKVFKDENIGSEFRKEKKSKASKADGKKSSLSRDDDISIENGRMMEEVRRNKDWKLQKHEEKVTSPRILDGVVDPMNRDVMSGHISVATTSSSSKVSGSRRSRSKFQEVRGSPVESVSSSPLRTSIPENFTPTRGENLGKSDPTNRVMPVLSNLGRCLDVKGNAVSNQSGRERKEKGFRVRILQSHENSKSGQQDRDANYNSGSNDLHSVEHDHCDDNHFRDNALFPQKYGKGSSLPSKGKDRSSRSFLDTDKIKVSNQSSEQEQLHPKKSLRNNPEVESHHFAGSNDKMNNLKVCFPEKSSIKSSKDEKDHIKIKKDSLGNQSNYNKNKNLEHREQGGSDVKLVASCSTDGEFTPSQSVIQDLNREILLNQFLGHKVDSTQIEEGVVKSELFPYCEGQKQTLAKGLGSIPVSQKGDFCNSVPCNVSGDVDVIRTSKQPGNVNNRDGAHRTLKFSMPNQCKVRDPNASSPDPERKDSSTQTASNALKEAKDLRSYADYLKNSGFDFESNEAYFQAALKFLHAASRLESSNGDDGRHGEISQVQAYSITTKLCELCAHEYESHQETAAAALAYKCMEIAYMRIVYCKHFTTSRDRHELQATLQMVPQGESPSSSASDVDNLNNQAAADKAALLKGSGSHVAGQPVIVARNCSNFVRLLDFTQDVNLAMEASSKSQKAFAAANVILKEAQNEEGITSVKKVIDFSFHDVEGLVRLVGLAMGAISRSGFS